jgi:protein-tyrosine kinase
MAKMLDALERARQERLKTQMGPALNTLEPPAHAAAPAPLHEARPTGPTAQPAHHAQISEMIVGAHDQRSPITEQVSQIRTNLETVLAEYRSRTIVVTSPVAGDGKTLVAANLATVLADDPDNQVLLVDADMRKCDQHRLFGLPMSPGLSECLRDRCTLDEATYKTSLPNLSIVPAGRMPEKPTVLLGSDRMISLLGEWQRTYRWIVLDTPPLLPVTDALVLARECIGLIMVVRMGQTSEKVIIRAQDLLAEMRLPVLGCILNDFNNHSKENAYYYRYYKRPEDDGGFVS